MEVVASSDRGFTVTGVRLVGVKVDFTEESSRKMSDPDAF